MELSKMFLDMENPIDKGSISQQLAKVYFSVRGWACFEPTTESGRVDYVISTEEGYKKVQVKTVSKYEATGKFRIFLAKSGKNKKVLKYTEDELDMLIAYSPHHNAIVQIPGNLAHGKDTLTFSSKKDGNYCGTSKFIEDYIVFTLG
jgi:hypothetical protein